MSTTSLPSEEVVPVRLVPVSVFGTEDCCEHDFDTDCESKGFGFCDAVSPWSDCNRATGRVYRVDDVDEHFRSLGETVTVYVPRSALPFFERSFAKS